jgi:uncharacterized protein (TIGR03435 family)
MFLRTLSCVAMLSFAASAAIAQEKPAADSPATVEAARMKSIRFEVVSIRPSDPKKRGGTENWTPSGFIASCADLWELIVQAYFGGNQVPRNPVNGYPVWAGNDGECWDIEAKVAPEDIAEYQRHQPKMEDPPEALGWSMLRALLIERFYLQVHSVPGQIDGYALVVDKNGPKLKVAAPNEAQPPGTIPNHDGYIDFHGDSSRVSFYSFTMGALASYLHWTSAAVVDRTALTGRYDFTLKWLSSGDENDRPGMIPAHDPAPLSHWDFGALGLRVEHVKLPTEYIVVDHVERPTAN